MPGRKQARPGYEHTSIRVSSELYDLLWLYAIKEKRTIVDIVEQELKRFATETLRKYVQKRTRSEPSVYSLRPAARKYRARGALRRSATISFWHRITEKEAKQGLSLIDRARLASKLRGLSLSLAFEEHLQGWAKEKQQEVDSYLREALRQTETG